MLHTVSWKSAHRFWRRRFLSSFNHIWAWRPSWSCDLDFPIKLSSPLSMDAPHKILLIGRAVSEKKIFENCVWTTDWARSRDDLVLY